MGHARSLSVIVFMVLGTILLLSANLGVWVNRSVYNTDGFVSTTAPIFQNEDVQQQLATDISTQIITAANLEPRVQEQLPEGLKFLALPLTTTLQEFLERTTLRILQSDRVQALIEGALRVTHTQVRRIIDSDNISVSGDSVVIDLRPIVDAVVSDIGLGDAASGNSDRLLAKIDLPDDAGQFEVENSVASWVLRIARFGEKVIVALVIATVLAFAAALLLARDRRQALGTIGKLMIVAGFVSLMVLVPVRYVGGEAARNKDAARAVISIVTFQFQLQSGLLVLFGLILGGIAFLMSDTRLARGLRSRIRSNPNAPAQEPLGNVIRDYAGTMRFNGIVVAVALLIAWPEPSTRVQLTILGLLVAYLALIWAIASDSDAASRTRSTGEGAWRRYVLADGAEHTAQSDVGGWIAARAGALRAAGVLLAIAVVLLTPGLSFQLLISVVLVLLGYLAVVEFASNR